MDKVKRKNWDSSLDELSIIESNKETVFFVHIKTHTTAGVISPRDFGVVNVRSALDQEREIEITKSISLLPKVYHSKDPSSQKVCFYFLLFYFFFISLFLYFFIFYFFINIYISFYYYFF